MSRARRVVITGMGVVSPIGSGIFAFFRGLAEARPGVDLITAFDASAFPTRLAGEVRDLDLAAVPLPPAARAALLRDPKSVFGIVAAREALLQACGPAGALADHHPRERIRASLATGLEIFHLPDLVPFVAGGEVQAGLLLERQRQAPPGAYLQLPAHLGARIAAREAGAAGGLSVNVSACAAGTQAVGEAFWAIRDGAADAVLAGGYDSMVNPLGVGGFCLLQAMSTANDRRGAASRPFDALRDGFVLGEGAGMVVLEEAEAATRRGAPILAELLGYGSTLDAFQVTAPAPDRAGAVAALRAALADAELEPAMVDYINAHGTGTRLNDVAETAAIREVFGPHADRLPVSSTKSQLGHLIGAAGAVELVATLFALREGLLPATINLTHPDPQCDLDYVALTPRPARVRIALTNSFGFGGQNAALLVGQWEPASCKVQGDR